MPACVHCGDMLTDAEWKSGTCPMCGDGTGSGSAGASNVPAANPDAALIPPDTRPGWGTLRAGFGIIVASMVLMWGFGAAMWFAFHAVQEADIPSAGAQTTLQMASIGLIIAIFSGLIGVLTCNGAPSGTATRPWIIGATGSIAMSFVLFMFAAYMENANRAAERRFQRSKYEQRYSRSSRFEPVVHRSYNPPHKEETIVLTSKIARCTGGVSWLLFLMFLWSAARNLRSSGLAISTLCLAGVAAVFQIAYFYSIWTDTKVGFLQLLEFLASKDAEINTGFALCGFFLTIWYVGTLLVLRHRITKLMRL